MQGLSHSKEQTNEEDLGEPQQNASIESFNGSLRDEHLNEELFDRLADARRKLAVWRYHCNNARPHSPLVTTNIKPADSRYDRRTSGGAGQTPKSKSAAARQLSKLRLAGSGISRHSHRLIKRRVLVDIGPRGIPDRHTRKRSSGGRSGHWRTIMEMSETAPTATKRQVWNAGRTVGAKRALKPKQIWEIRFFLNQRRRLRDRALFDLAIDSKLRGCDLVQMKIGDLVSGGQIRTRAIVMQQKTGRPVQFELLPDARASLLAWLERRGGTVDDYVFPSRVDHNGHLSTRQYARLVDEWVTGVGLMRSEYGTHSLRRTKASIIYRATGNLRAVQILLGHSKIENTVRYLGIDVEDALALAENTEI